MKNKIKYFTILIIFVLCKNATVYADEYLMSDDITFIIPEYVSIENDSSSVYAEEANVTSSKHIRIDNPIKAAFNISTSDKDGVEVKISASSYVDTDSSIENNIANNVIVFTKSDGSTSSSAVKNITGGSPSSASNPNAIAFPIKCTEGEQNTEGNIVYTVKGSKEISCSIIGTATDGTFAINDEAGNYSAVLTLSQIGGNGSNSAQSN